MRSFAFWRGFPSLRNQATYENGQNQSANVKMGQFEASRNQSECLEHEPQCCEKVRGIRTRFLESVRGFLSAPSTSECLRNGEGKKVYEILNK